MVIVSRCQCRIIRGLFEGDEGDGVELTYLESVFGKLVADLQSAVSKFVDPCIIDDVDGVVVAFQYDGHSRAPCERMGIFGEVDGRVVDGHGMLAVGERNEAVRRIGFSARDLEMKRELLVQGSAGGVRAGIRYGATHLYDIGGIKLFDIGDGKVELSCLLVEAIERIGECGIEVGEGDGIERALDLHIRRSAKRSRLIERLPGDSPSNEEICALAHDVTQ